MRLPANLASQTTDTGNGGGGLITTTVLAAPGASSRRRVWAITVADRSAGAPALFTGYLRFQSIGAATAGPMMSIQNGICSPVWLPGGLPLPTNVGLELVHAYSVAGVVITVVVFYTTESV